MAHGGQQASSFWALLARSLVSALVLCALLTVSQLPQPGSISAARGDDAASAVPWKESWSARYPGCVSMLLWPREERPVALVAQLPDGRVTRVPVDGTQPFDDVPSGALALGACR